MTRRLILLALLIAPALPAQKPEPVRLSTVLGAFLVDSGVRTRALPWTTGSALPVTWESAGPVPTTDQWARNQGITHTRIGRFTALVGDTVALPATITLSGTQAGLSGMGVLLTSMLVEQGEGGYFVTRQMIEKALVDEGAQLQPLKCSRDTEGASYGNLVDAFRMPGKTASGLWWMWQSPMQEMQVSLQLLYRRADMAQVECFSG